MPIDKTIGLGTIVKYDHDNNASYDAIDCVTSLQPPGRSYERVDETCLADTLMTAQQGIESSSDFSFTQIYDDGDANAQRLDSAFASKHNYTWQIVFPYDTPRTWQFTGRIMSLEMGPVDTGSILTRSVVVHRTSAITKS